MNSDGAGSKGLIIGSVVFILIVGAIFFAVTGDIFNDRNEPADTSARLTDIYDGRSVRMTVEGPIVADEIRESYQIEVGVDNRKIEVFNGYERAVVSSQTFSNNRPAYTEFVFALERAGFDETREVSDNAADERGACAKGKSYIFELLDDGRSLFRTWTTSCSKIEGTLDGDASKIKDLFNLQIVGRNDILQDTRLR